MNKPKKFYNEDEIKEYVYGLYERGSVYDFRDCVFNTDVTLNSYVFDKLVIFNYCTFNKHVFFSESEFKEGVEFVNSTFKQGCCFADTEYGYKADFRGANFTGRTDFAKAVFKEVDFREAVFNSGSIFIETKFYGKANFTECETKGAMQFDDSDFHEEAQIALSSEDSSSEVYFSGVSFMKDTHFGVHRTKFKQSVAWFYHTKFFGTIVFNCEIKNYLAFSSCSFYTGLKIIASEIGRINFESIRVLGDLEINNSSFSDLLHMKFAFVGGRTTIDKVILKGVIELGRNSLRKGLTFSVCEFKGIAAFFDKPFNKASFLSSVFFNSALFNNIRHEGADLTFSQVQFKTILSFDNSKFHKLDMRSVSISDDMFVSNFSVEEANRETYRFIKDHYFKQNNRVEGLKYHQKEMREYTKSFKFFSLRSLGDRTVLYLNYISNFHGDSWFTGILFFICISMLFFWLFIDSLGAGIIDNESQVWGVFAKYYCQFANPAHRFSAFKDLELTGASYLWDSLGRIFGSYAIYQTIQAFRKFGKTS